MPVAGFATAVVIAIRVFVLSYPFAILAATVCPVKSQAAPSFPASVIFEENNKLLLGVIRTRSLLVVSMGRVVDASDAEFDMVTKSSEWVLVDFWAPWCGPCKMLTPILEKVKAEVGDKAMIAKVNVDENPDLAAKFGIRSIPSLLLFDSGEMKETLIGLKQQKELVALLTD